MPQASALLNVMIAAARKAARALSRDFGEVENLQVSRKGPADFVSSADLKAEKTLYEELAKARPGYGFLMEERGAVDGTDKTNTWIVDPLDGTTNFLHGIPHFAISIGLEREGILVAGVVYNPVRDELFWAEKGARRLSQRSSLAHRRAQRYARCGIRHRRAFPWPAWTRRLSRRGGAGDRTERRHTPLRRRFSGSRYVAAGRFDGFWERGLSAWDVAAGAVIVREAGGFVKEIDGGDFLKTGNIIAANERLLPALTKLVRNA